MVYPEVSEIMKRRSAIKSLGGLTAGAIILPQMLTGCDKGPYKYELFNWGDTEWFDDLAGFILPATADSAGADKAGVGEFIQIMVTDNFKPADQEAFIAGLAEFRTKIETAYQRHFIDLNQDEKGKMLEELRSEASAYSIPEGGSPHFYHMLHPLTLMAYFTSEEGMTKALRYKPIPGEQKGVVPYNGEKAWAIY